MKKNTFIIGTISLLSVTALAIGAAAAAGSLKIPVSDDGIAERDDVAKVAAVQLFSDEKIQLNYDLSRSVKDGFADVYKDEKGNDYIYKNGKLTGFYSNEIKNPAADAEPIGQDAAIKIAKDWLSQFSDNIDEYVLESFMDKENYGQYYITFARKIGNIFTEESADVSVMYDGGVKSVAVRNDGMYDNVSEDITGGITEDDLLLYARSELDIIYPGNGNSFDMSGCLLEHDENGYFIEISGGFEDESGISRAETVRYELEG